MRVGDKVRTKATVLGVASEGVVVAVFPEDGDANIKVKFGFTSEYGDFYEEELEVVS